MGINMDIRNESGYSFMNFDGLEDAEKNKLLAILSTRLPGVKLPWDNGEEYELDSDGLEIQVEDDSNQWLHYGMTESIPGYDSCVTTSPMMTTLPHHFPPHMIAMYREGGFPGMENPFGNSASGDPNPYPYAAYSYTLPTTMYSPGAELMSQPSSRDNDRRGGRTRVSGGGSGGKRDSYNRMMNSNNDIQTGYVLQGQTQYGQIVPLGPSSAHLYLRTPQGHAVASTGMYLQQQTPAYSQGPQLFHSSHGAYGHHPTAYPTHTHSPSSTKHRGATYYNQENMKNPTQKHHDKRGYQQDNCPTSTFRHSSNNETESPKKTYGKSIHVSNSNDNSDVRNNAAHNNSTARHTNNKKVTFSANDAKVESSDVASVKEEVPETIVQHKETLPVAAIDNDTVTASAVVKDKASQEKKVPPPAEDKVPATKARVEIQHPPQATKFVETPVVELKEPTVAVKTEKPQEGSLPAKILETPPVPMLASIVTAASVVPAPPPSRKTWANIVVTGGPLGDSIRSPPPITKLPVARVISVNNPPTSEPVAVPKTFIQEPILQPRNENVAPTAIRDNTEPTLKTPESSPWAETKVSTEPPQQNNLNDPAAFRMGELLLKYQMDKQTVSLLPRGLTNRSNYCYINSILQALLACPPFYNLLMALPYPRNQGKNSSTPLIDNMARFVREFSPLAEGARMPRKDRSQKRGEETAVEVQLGAAFEPSYVYTMLKNTSCAGVFSVEGRQEDAEEFLSCLLNGISDEMLELMKLVSAESNDAAPDTAEPNANHNNEEEGWKVMGPKNKGSITRCTEFGRTPLSDIFRGQLRSRVTRSQEEPTDNVQPFFTLQLDIEKAESVEGALETLFGKDRVEGMTCSKTKQQIEAFKQVSLEELPVILILHLMWFDYKLDGCSKIVKRVGFPIELKLDPKKLSSLSAGKKPSRKHNQYKLFAVTYHDGKEASKGHYVTDAFHVGYGTWIRYDDSSVKGIYEADVLNPSPPRVPYLLYYRRCDTIGNNPPNTPRTR